jgi:hypothetical protein
VYFLREFSLPEKIASTFRLSPGGKLSDPFGHQWGLAQHLEDVAPDEMMRRSAEWTAKMAKAAGQS